MIHYHQFLHRQRKPAEVFLDPFFHEIRLAADEQISQYSCLAYDSGYAVDICESGKEGVVGFISTVRRKCNSTMDDPIPRHCKICAKTWPFANHFIGALGLTDAYLFEDQFFPGWTVLALKAHRTELFQLTQGERGQLMEDVSRVGETLTQVFTVRKINSELLGNQVPHIHWHVVPRLIADPDPLKTVWSVSHEPVRLTIKGLDERLRLLRGALGIS